MYHSLFPKIFMACPRCPGTTANGYKEERVLETHDLLGATNKRNGLNLCVKRFNKDVHQLLKKLRGKQRTEAQLGGSGPFPTKRQL